MSSTNPFSEIDDVERFTREFMDKFEDNPELDRKHDVVDYDDILTFINVKVEEAATGTEQDARKTRLRQKGAGSEYTYNVAGTDAVLTIRVPATDRDELLYGRLNQNLKDQTIDNEQIAEEGTFLHEIRKKAQETAENNQTEYLFPGDLNDEPLATHPGEQIYEMTIPINYDEQTLNNTLDAIVTTAEEIDKLYQQALSVPAPQTQGQ